MAVCYLAFGGNKNDVQQTMQQAYALLAAHAEIRICRMSSIYRTAPVGTDAGGTFLNAACEIETSLTPIALLDFLQQVELQLGRTHTQHWGPRTIDIDILLYDQKVVEHPRLIIPHPACWYRRFVLDPLAEIAREVLHPVKRITIQGLQQRLLQRPLTVALAEAESSQSHELIEAMSKLFPEVVFSHWTNAEAMSHREPTLLVWSGCRSEHRTERLKLVELPLLDLSQAEDIQTALRDVLYSAVG